MQLPCLRQNTHLAEKVNAEPNKNSISHFKQKKRKTEEQPLHVRAVTDSLLFSLSLCGKQNNWCLLNNSIVHKQSVRALLMSRYTIVFAFSLRRRNNLANTITVTGALSYAPFSFMLYYKVYKECEVSRNYSQNYKVIIWSTANSVPSSRVLSTVNVRQFFPMSQTICW